jgi:hypothetical protein
MAITRQEARAMSDHVLRSCWRVAIAVVCCAGCGDDHLPLGKVSGTVTLDGAPLARGIVHFIPHSGPAATGVVRDGGYVLSTYDKGDGAMLGRHTIYLAPDIDESYMQGYTPADYAAGKPPPTPPTQSALPPKYLTPSMSGLSVEVVDGNNVHDLQLVSDARQR